MSISPGSFSTDQDNTDQYNEDQYSEDQYNAEAGNEDGCDYAVSIKLNIPISVEPQVFIKAGSLCTTQKFQIRIQPEIQMSPEFKASATTCVAQNTSGDGSDGYFPELIVEGVLEQA